MIEAGKIESLISEIAREFKPQRIILFGSHASGNATPDSDVDLLVVMPFEGKPVRKAIEIKNRVKARFPLELIVRTPEQLAYRMANNDWFIREIVEKGRTLYEADRA
jgi:uncharacterized protein